MATKIPKLLRFSGQVALVTGGSGGIGFGIASRLGSEGAKIALIDQNKIDLQRKVDELKEQKISAIGFVSDVSNQDHVQRSVEEAISAFGQIDILINSAGITGITNVKTHMVDLEDFQRVVEVNLFGTLLYCHAVLPQMLKRNYGRIVNIASISGKEGNPGMAAYSTSKAAVIGLTKVIGKEYADTKITCNAVAPGLIKTPLVSGIPTEQVDYMAEKIPMKRLGTVNEIAGLVSYIASKESSFVTGFVYDCSGGRATY